jgi:hypothetical protein
MRVNDGWSKFETSLSVAYGMWQEAEYDEGIIGVLNIETSQNA